MGDVTVAVSEYGGESFLSEDRVLAKDFKQINLFELMNWQILRCHPRFLALMQMAAGHAEEGHSNGSA